VEKRREEKRRGMGIDGLRLIGECVDRIVNVSIT
jgi:hypothetical protein